MADNRLIGLGLGIVGLWVLFVAGCDKAEPTVAVVAAPPAGRAPDAEPTHLQVVDLDGLKTLIAESAADQRVLVIDFWATWCVPCVQMFPGLHAGLVARGAGDKPGDPVRAVSVTLDDPSREASAVDFLREHDALHDAYIFASDSAAQQALADGLGEKWNSLVVPAILVYDSSGTLVGEYLEGGSTATILEHVDRLLASDQEDQP